MGISLYATRFALANTVPLCRRSIQEKLKFLFMQHDVDQSGFLEHNELLPMFQKLTDQLVKLEEASRRRNELTVNKTDVQKAKILRSTSKVNELAEDFKKASDLDGDGKISYEEFENYMEKNELCRKFLQVMSETGNTLREENTNFS